MSALLDTPRLTVPVDERDHVHGPPTAPVTLVEYGDYECPFCGAAHRVVHELQRMLADDLRFAFRHFPLTRFTIERWAPRWPPRQRVRRAGSGTCTTCCSPTSRAWDLRRTWPLARTLALDLARFTRDFEQETYAPRIREDFMSGVRSGVNGTPTFFINGVRHNGGFDLQSMLDATGDVIRVGSL